MIAFIYNEIHYIEKKFIKNQSGERAYVYFKNSLIFRIMNSNNLDKTFSIF